MHARLVTLTSFMWLSIGLGACTITSEREVTPWFKLRDQHPTIDIPHGFASGHHVVSTWMKAGGQWIEVVRVDEDGINNHPSAWRLDRGEAVLLESGADYFVYRRLGDRRASTKLPCGPTPAVSNDGAIVVCYECRFPRPRELGCWGGDVRVLRSDGSIVAHFLIALPEKLDGDGPMFTELLGFLSDGRPLLVATYHIPEPFFSRCVLIAMDANGGQVLADERRMKECEAPRMWAPKLPAGLKIDVQGATAYPHDPS